MKARSCIGVVAAVFILAGLALWWRARHEASSAGPPAQPSEPAASGDKLLAKPELRAVLTLGRKAGTVVVEYHNRTAKEVRESEQVLITPQLALEVHDSTGAEIHPGPPPVPWAQDDGIRIAPGGVERCEYDLGTFRLSRRPGLYFVRVRLEEWECEPLAMTIEDDKPRKEGKETHAEEDR